MNHFLKNQLKLIIKNLEIKIEESKTLKIKIKLLIELQKVSKQYENILETEHKSLETKYENVSAEKIRNINRQIDKAESRGKFMLSYSEDLRTEALLSQSDYLSFIDNFWRAKISPLNSEVTVLVRFLIELSDTSARTMTKTEVIKNDVESLNSFKEIVKENINIIYSHYLSPEEDNMIRGFIMKYKILRNTQIKQTVVKKAMELKKARISRTVKIRNINYPLSSNSIDFGDVQTKEGNLTIVTDISKALTYEFERSTDSQTIKIFKGGKRINTLMDHFIDLDNNLFKRTVNNLAYFIKNSKVILKTKEYSPKFISKAKLDKVCSDNLYTADIETLTKVDSEGKRYFEPYSIAYYDGFKSQSYYVTDYTNWDEMMYKFWKDLFSLELKNTDIYFHNLSGFDVNFLLRGLLNIANVQSDIMLREDKFIQIKISYGETSFNIKDSLLLLPGSLNNLSNSFKIETPKEIFPRKLFESETFPADYISSSVPDYKYFNQSEVSLDDYDRYCERFKGRIWSLKTETLKYVDIDCIALHQILTKFGEIIYGKWGIDIKHTPTLPALCFKIYRVRYMPKDTIPIITGTPYRDIKQAYTGGSTDMYIPYGENVWCYDINSLYPAAMKKYKYPVGNFMSFSNLGNLSISALENVLQRKIFGFVEAEVDCPLGITHPILQIRREVSNNLRTFAPSGNFKGWFQTEEVNEAIKLGYKVKIISGYLFDKADIFSDYVDDLYKIKQEADLNKDPVWRLISKNLMNSLYGRFGMNQYIQNNIILDKDDLQLESLYERAEVEDIIELDNKLLIQYLPKGFNNYSYQEDLEINISVPISASVAAYSRIIMMKYKNNLNYNLHYTDTDSLYITFKSDLDRLNFEKNFVDPLELGFLKIENTKIEDKYIPYERFYFVAPKFYAAILNNQIDFNKTKIRGLQKTYRSMIDEEKIKSLLNYHRDPIKIETVKWFKNLSESKIYIEKRPYHLDIANFKRSLIYNYYTSDKILLESTKSIEMKDNKISSVANVFIKEGKLSEDLSNIKD